MILVCGEALFDVFVLPTSGELLNMEAIRGGSPYNVALGLARLGETVSFFGGLSSDPFGVKLRHALEQEGVQTNHAPLVQANTTLALVQLDENGVPQYAFYGEGAADRHVLISDIPALTDDVTALHFGSFSLVVKPSGPTFLAFAKAHAGKKLISYDPNIRPTVVSDMAIWRTCLQEWLQVADVVKISHEDLDLMFPGQNPVEVVRPWLDYAPSLVVITQGARGAVGVSHKGTVHVEALPIDVVDTVGAGDSFQAALLHQLHKAHCFKKADLDELPLETLKAILRFAVAASGLTCTRRGANLPYVGELEGA